MLRTNFIVLALLVTTASCLQLAAQQKEKKKDGEKTWQCTAAFLFRNTNQDRSYITPITIDGEERRGGCNVQSWVRNGVQFNGVECRPKMCGGPMCRKLRTNQFFPADDGSRDGTFQWKSLATNKIFTASLGSIAATGFSSPIRIDLTETPSDEERVGNWCLWEEVAAPASAQPSKCGATWEAGTYDFYAGEYRKRLPNFAVSNCTGDLCASFSDQSKWGKEPNPVQPGDVWAPEVQYKSLATDRVYTADVVYNWYSSDRDERWLGFWTSLFSDKDEEVGGGWCILTACETSSSDCSSPTKFAVLDCEIENKTQSECEASGSSGSSGGAAKGDPHLVNIKGEAFDVMQTGKMMLLEIPRGSSPATLDLALHADIERLGAVLCGPTFITSAYMTGRWLGVPVEIRAGPIAKKNTKLRHFFGIRLDRKDWVAHVEQPKTMDLTKDAAIVIQDRIFLFKVRGLSIQVSQPKRPRVFLDVQVKGLGFLTTEIGGLLGIDEHASAEELPSECKVDDATSLKLARLQFEDLQWSARAE